MNENIQIMLQKLSEDEEAQKKLSTIHNPEEAYQLVSAIHGGYTKEEFIAAMTTLQEQMNQDLTDADLSKTSGGEEEVGATAFISCVVGSVVTCTGAGWVLSAAM